MTTELALAYGGYLAWLAAGLGDFACHRRTDLPHTSGVAESLAHLVQLGLLGAAIVVGLAFEVGRASLASMFALVAAHAVVGFVDTRIAFGRGRTLRPIEQHLHSVLDMAPWIALGWLAASTWPDAVGGPWALEPRQPSLAAGAWLAVLAPALALGAAPAVLELRAARRAARSGGAARTRYP